jgi:rubrerythrin
MRNKVVKATLASVIAVVIGLGTGVSGALAAQSSHPTPEVLLQGIKVACTTEMINSSKYGAFAAQADKDGNPGAARLFRAMEFSRHVEASNFEAMLSLLSDWKVTHAAFDGTPGTVSEDLSEALKDQRQSRDVMYAPLIKTARATGHTGIATLLVYAHHAAAEQVAILENVSQKPAELGRVKTYFVCPQCGATLTTLGERTFCPGCRAPIFQLRKIR